jgi:CheY-like chemotaxis protein
VLVVDDDHLVRILVQLGLERDGVDVWLAADGREATRLYRAHRESITVVLLDVHMPGPDGPATLDALRGLNPDVLVCFMSGDTGDYDPQELLRRGAARIIAKPFPINQLANDLRLLTQGVPADVLPSVGDARGDRGREPGPDRSLPSRSVFQECWPSSNKPCHPPTEGARAAESLTGKGTGEAARPV